MKGRPLQEDFEDFFEQSLCGYITLSTKGNILRCNGRFAGWLQYGKEELEGRRFSSLLAVGGKMYYQTHLAPLIHLQGFFDEAELELVGKHGERFSCLVNGYERRDEQGIPLFVRLTLVKATERHNYEENLRSEKTAIEVSLSAERQMAVLREQFIAVLGHDLRNPLSSVAACANILLNDSSDKQTLQIAGMIKKSSSRMKELVDNLMDFARVRLGDGLNIKLKSIDLEPVLLHVVNELRSVWPAREIQTQFSFNSLVSCDSDRIAQLLSNLVANAVTHGQPGSTVLVAAHSGGGTFELSVTNQGTPIPAESLQTLFEPFTREKTNPGKQGLGLGLYISAEIARAHGGLLTVISDAAETRFAFRMLQPAEG